MATHLSKLKKRNGDIILPITRSEGVILDDGTTVLQTKLDAIDLEISNKAPINNPTFTGTVGGINASMVGLGNVDNTSDANKPISSATQTALNNKAPIASPTFTGTPTLSGVGRIIADSASTGTDVYYVWSGTQVQYDAIGTKDANTLYFIVG